MFIHRLLASAVLAVGFTASAGASQNYIPIGQSDFTTWDLFGSATVSQGQGNGYLYSSLMLTPPGQGGQAGAGYAPQPLVLDFNQPFTFTFPFFIAPGSVLRGDGMTFVLAEQPGLGDAGSGLGYQNLPGRSLAFAIDTFHFDGEPVSPSLQILADGNTGAPMAVQETGMDDQIRDQSLQWIGTLDFAPSGAFDETGSLIGTLWRPDIGTFSVTASGVDLSVLGPIALDGNDMPLGRLVYFGFTAAGGLADDGHFVSSAVPVPEPHTYAMLLAGMLLMGAVVRRRAVMAR